MLYGVQNAPKESAASATVSAMNAMSSRMDGLKESEAFNLNCKKKAEMILMKSKENVHDSEYRDLREVYKVARVKGTKNEMASMKERRNKAKRMSRTYKKEYGILKEELGYESVECSSASSPSEEDDE